MGEVNGSNIFLRSYGFVVFGYCKTHGKKGFCFLKTLKFINNFGDISLTIMRRYIQKKKPRVIPNPDGFYDDCIRLGTKVIIVNRICLYTNKIEICLGCKYHEKKEEEK